MAPATFVFKKTRASIDAVTLDVSVSERHGAKAEITRHPVEQGVSIVDHIRPQPRTLQIEGLITNTPLPEPNDPLTPQTQGTVTFQSRSAADPGRTSKAYSDLLALMQAGRLFTVVTALATYENMALESLDVPRDATTAEVLRFSASFVEVKTIATAKTANIEPKAKAKTKLGKKAAPETPEQVRKQSIAYQIVDTFAPSLLKGAGK